jgi:hypothetical protein
MCPGWTQSGWSRGPELNRRPDDYEMDGFSPTRLATVSDVWRYSCSFGVIREPMLQRNLQRQNGGSVADTPFIGHLTFSSFSSYST